MKNLFRVLCGISVMSMIPAVAGAVGTYYNGNLYQNPQQRYSRGGYYNSYGYGSGRNYGQSGYGQQRAYGNQYNVERQLGTQKQQMQNKKTMQQTSAKQGLVLDAGISHEIGKWEFDMNNAGSHLHYDNLAWNVFDARGTYYFGDTTKMQINAGVRYGMQYGKSTMIDDDISSDKAIQLETRKEYDFEGNVVSGQFMVGNPAMSVGGSKDGTQMGFNVGFGLTDFFTWGKMKITPSIGYRYFKHKLTTKDNKGMAIGVFSGVDSGSAGILNCVPANAGSDELQCAPVLVFGNGIYSDGVSNYVGFDGYYYYSTVYPTELRDEETNELIGMIYPILNNPGAALIDTPGTYYYEQPGKSHEYKTVWAGPYLALDMEYQINNENLVTAGVEFGLPKYDSKGDQPYRWDWAHPTSVEDKGDFGDAYHLGLNANWKTAISDSMFLSLGFTYDYYKVSDATANTYLNGTYYQKVLDVVNDVLANADENDDVTYYEQLQAELNGYRSNGWKIEEKKEINSIYKSMGIRLGINMKF